MDCLSPHARCRMAVVAGSASGAGNRLTSWMTRARTCTARIDANSYAVKVITSGSSSGSATTSNVAPQSP